jgi:hypothetical protein
MTPSPQGHYRYDTSTQVRSKTNHELTRDLDISSQRISTVTAKRKGTETSQVNTRKCKLNIWTVTQRTTRIIKQNGDPKCFSVLAFFLRLLQVIVKRSITLKSAMKEQIMNWTELAWDRFHVWNILYSLQMTRQNHQLTVPLDCELPE